MQLILQVNVPLVSIAIHKAATAGYNEVTFSSDDFIQWCHLAHLNNPTRTA